ncbi:excinuclease ABC subunit UvrA, partial [Patescibacteria group bacterium]|nr:excinuclease ABC subunit UvrA [Patescibacteria group bacterium]
KDQKGEHKNVIEKIRKAGYVRIRFDGLMYTTEEAEALTIDKNKKHSLEVVVDRLVITKTMKIKSGDRGRLVDSMETALDLGNGVIFINKEEEDADLIFSQHFACTKCDMNLPEIEPRNFSFNNPHGACPACSGLGTKLEVDPQLIIPNKKLTLAQGAIRPWSRTSANQTWYFRILESVAKEHKFSVNEPVEKLSKKSLEVVLNGTGSKTYDVNNEFSGGKVREMWATYEGVIPNMERRYKETDSDYIRSEIERYMRIYPCPTCEGRRLKPEALAVTVGGNSIDQVVGLTIEQTTTFFNNLTKKSNKNALDDRAKTIADQILKEIKERLKFLRDVGLSYLTLDRTASTLAGGEAQRIRLATQIGSSLVGVVYILDEPSIGLHQRDNDKLIETLKRLKDLGNTVIVVEHDEAMIRTADYVVDIGPGAGEHGGEIVAQGSPAKVLANPKSLTGKYLSGKMSIPIPDKTRPGNGKMLSILGAEEFNLKKVDVDIPLGKFVCFTGVSGSGKSTLMTDILARALSQHFYRSKDIPGKHKEIRGMQHLDKVINIDQSPIGRTPRSNAATYTGVFTYIRDLFTQVPEAKIRGYKAGRFSFNVKGGRCEACQGEGYKKIEMQFLPDVYIECEECHGQRYNQAALDIHYKGRSIADVLDFTVEEALGFFENIPAIKQKLLTLNDVGLGYLHLGQSATTLSGGEAQRIKLATELSRRATGRTLYILDEPTTGLHFDDVKRLLQVLNKLVDKGNTVLIIEHNLDVIKSVDWVVDMGPEGGDRGGQVIAQGTPRDVAKVKKSYTGQYLKQVFSTK